MAAIYEKDRLNKDKVRLSKRVAVSRAIRRMRNTPLSTAHECRVEPEAISSPFDSLVIITKRHQKGDCHSSMPLSTTTLRCHSPLNGRQIGSFAKLAPCLLHKKHTKGA